MHDIFEDIDGDNEMSFVVINDMISATKFATLIDEIEDGFDELSADEYEDFYWKATNIFLSTIGFMEIVEEVFGDLNIERYTSILNALNQYRVTLS
jgi:hypothetical protein